MSESSGSLLPNLLDLSADLNYLLRGAILCDFSLYVNSKEVVYCHKDILINRSRWFSNQIRDSETRKITQLIMTEEMQILEAVLFYIYSGNLRQLEPLDISLLDLYQAAKKYGLTSLEQSLSVPVREKNVKEVTKTFNFLWKIKVEDRNSLTTEYSAKNGFSLNGTDKWKLTIKPMSEPDEDEPRHGVFIMRQSGDCRDTSHTMVLAVYVIDATGVARWSFPTVPKTFVEDGEYFLFNFLKHSEIMTAADSLLSGGVLTLSCQLSTCAKIGYLNKFRVCNSLEKSATNELVELSASMYNLYKYGTGHNTDLPISSSCILTFHSYIFFVRSRVPLTCLQDLQIVVRMGIIGWTSFICFLYTGQARFLDDHSRDVYAALSKMSLVEAKLKYSDYLSKNLTLENAFYVLCDAAEGKDDHLLNSAADFLAKKSNTITDQKVWVRIASDKVNSLMLFLPQFFTLDLKRKENVKI